jgi:hypothetical protein
MAEEDKKARRESWANTLSAQTTNAQTTNAQTTNAHE